MPNFDFFRLFSNNSHLPNGKNKRKRTCRFEELEGREMLSATPWLLVDNAMEAGSETTWSDRIDPSSDPVASVITYAPSFHSSSPLAPLAASEPIVDEVQEKYADLDLSGINNVIEIAADELSDANLRSAINTATTNGLDNLIIVHTTATDNKIVLSGTELSIPSGKVTIVALGDTNLTIDGDEQSRVLSIGSGAMVGLAGLTITKGKVTSGNGGGIYNDGDSLTLTNCTVSGNAGRNGGGIYIYSGTTTLNDCTIVENTANVSGGGIYNHGNSGTTLIATNCTISGNSTSVSGGTCGGGIFNANTMTLTNCTITGNTADSGSGIYQLNGTTTLNNTIIAFNTGNNDIYRSGGTVSASNSFIGDGTNSTLTNGVDGNIVGTSADPIDPLFIDAENGDYRLAPGSPAIDKGDNDYVPVRLMTDLEGKPRIANGIVDMGAYEFCILLTGITPSTDSPQVGTTITMMLDPDEATATFEWYRGETLVSTADTYTPVAADVGKILKVVVTGTGYYAGEKDYTFNATTASLTGITPNTDSPQVGTIITTTLAPASAMVEYQWYRGATAIYGATSSSYTPVAADVGQFLKVVATGKGDYVGMIERTLTDAVIFSEFNAHDWQKLVDAGLIDAESNYFVDRATIVFGGNTGDVNRRLVRLDIRGLDFPGNSGTLDLSDCDALVYLDCAYNQLTTLNLTGCTELTTLDCSYNKLADLMFTGCSALSDMQCESNLLTALDVSGLANLEVFQCFDNQLTTLTVSGCSALIRLECGLNQLTTLNVSGCVKLETLSCFDNQLTALNVSGCVNLESLWCGGNALKFNTLPSIGSAVTYNYVTVFDMEGNPSNVGQARIGIALSSTGTITLPDVGATGWTWYINGKLTTAYTKAGNVFTFTKLKVGDVLRCEMTNATYYRLTLLTNEVTSSVATAPNILSVTKKAGNTVAVTLSWESGTLNWGTGYEIQFSVDGGKTWAFWTNGSTTAYTGGTSLDLTNLSASNYQFRVRSVKVDGGNIVDASDWSVVKTETLTALNDTVATKLKKVTVGKKKQNEAPTISTVTLNVVPGNSNASSYIVVGTYKVGKNTVFAEFSYTVVGNKLVIMGLNAGTKYTFYVAAVNDAGNTSGSAGKYVNGANQAQAVKDLAKDKAFVKASAKTTKYPANKVKAVPKSAGLNFINFTTTPPKKPADMSGYTCETKIVVSYTVKVNQVKTTYEGTLIEGVLGTNSLKAIVKKRETTWVGEHPLNNLAASVEGNEVTTLNGLPASGTKYTVVVSTLASGLNGTVESATAKSSVSTLKFTAPKKLKYVGVESGKIKLQWKIDPKISAFVNLNGYILTPTDGTGIAVTNVSVDSQTGLATGYFVPQAGVKTGTKYTYFLMGKSLSSAGGFTSLATKITIKMPSL